MSRQYQFYIDESSYPQIDELVVSLGGAILACPKWRKQNSLKKISSISYKDDGDFMVVYIYPKNEESKIVITESININNEKYYSIEELTSPIIEFDRCYYNKETNKLNEGRVYYNKGYWGEDGNYVMKDEAFLKFADQFFSKQKKMLVRIKEGKFKSWYASKEVLEKVKNGELHLKFTHEK